MQIDILSSGGQKSLMGPPGQGFLYVRDAVARTLHPGIIGPLSVEGWQDWLCYDLTPRESALRFTMGTHSLSGMAGLSASIHSLCSIGIEHIDSWTRHLAQVAAEDLTAHGYAVITPSDPAQHGPILTFRVGDPNHPKEADAQADVMVSRLDENRIKVSKRWDAHHIPHVRISTHCYNTEDEVRQIGAVLGDCRS
jgi:cysteine desulfurase/selenocysteine lyase